MLPINLPKSNIKNETSRRLVKDKIAKEHYWARCLSILPIILSGNLWSCGRHLKGNSLAQEELAVEIKNNKYKSKIRKWWNWSRHSMQKVFLILNMDLEMDLLQKVIDLVTILQNWNIITLYLSTISWANPMDGRICLKVAWKNKIRVPNWKIQLILWNLQILIITIFKFHLLHWENI